MWREGVRAPQRLDRRRQRAAERAGFFVDYQAQTHSGAALANELGEKLRDQTVFLPRSDRANPDLPQLLRNYGAEVTEVIAYRTVTPVNLDEEKIAAIVNGEVEAILFFSPTAVEHFLGIVGTGETSRFAKPLGDYGRRAHNRQRIAPSGCGYPAGSRGHHCGRVIAALDKHFAATPKASASE